MTKETTTVNIGGRQYPVRRSAGSEASARELVPGQTYHVVTADEFYSAIYAAGYRIIKAEAGES